MSCSASSDDGRTALTDLQYDPLYKAVGHDWRSTGLVNKQLLSLVRKRTLVTLQLSGEEGNLLQQLPLHRAWRNCRSLRYTHEIGLTTEELEAAATALEYGAEHWLQLREVHLLGVGCRCSSSATLWQRIAAALQRCRHLQHVTLDRCLISLGLLPTIPQLKRLLLSTSSVPPEELQQPLDAEARPALIKVADLTPLAHLKGLKQLQLFNLAPQESTAAVAAAAGEEQGAGALDAGETSSGARSPIAASAAASGAEAGDSGGSWPSAAGDASTAAGTAVGCLPPTLEQLQLCIESITRWVPHLAAATSLTSLHIFHTMPPTSLHSDCCFALTGLPQLRSLTISMDRGYLLHPSEEWQGLGGLTHLQMEGCWVACKSPGHWGHLVNACGGLKVLQGLYTSCAPPPELQLGQLEQLTMTVGCLHLVDIPVVLSACPRLRSVVLRNGNILSPQAALAPLGCKDLQQLDLLLLAPAAAHALVKAAPAGLQRLKVHLPGDVVVKAAAAGQPIWDFSHLTALTHLAFANWGLVQQLQAAVTAPHVRSLQLCLLYTQSCGGQGLTLAQLQELCGKLPALEELSCHGSKAQAAQSAAHLSCLAAQLPRRLRVVTSGSV